MLSDNPVFPTLPTTNIQKAKVFYRNKLGLKILYEEEQGIIFQAGKNSRIYMYKRPPSSADHTQAAFYVKDIYKKIEELEENGIEFLQYDNDRVKTDKKGVAKRGKQKAAWFKDPDGNILGLSQIK